MKEYNTLIDSSFLIATLKTNDSLHKRANEIMSLLSNERCIYITNLCLTETFTVLAQRFNKEVTVKLAKEILSKNSNIKIIFVDERLYELGIKFFSEDNRKNISFTDACSLACIYQFQFKNFLTFDRTDFGKYEKVLKFRIID